ncbi:DinB superfamily protein [Pirellulimonas nuda]|uniref:DinB superfamily protein n=1 Tax=Pirellulimonas nuda TaxID=2528009 RepID=A0A518D9B2_9BACT|nr:DinB family protein [Pirellulimonas nuda]QDU88062.1 DinB superfamily protein [Pirellulimonas nuda]
MNDPLLRLYDFTLGYCQRLLEDVDEEQMQLQPSPGVNPPAWIVGHLAICTDFALGLLGEPKRLPAEWSEEFGPGSEPLSQQHPYPSKAELLIALKEGHAAVVAALPRVDPESLTVPNPIESAVLRRAFPTAGDLLAHLMSTHESFHLGHLSNWRRQMGRPPLF